MPPATIRVLRGTGQVEVVDFKRYVVVVTAKEWPSYLPKAAIEAGAAAVKQYGWVKTLAGNHRPYYVTKSGSCYDVIDGTRDQLYKPHLAKVTARVRGAVERIWNITLRKDGRFFETGYRTGTGRRCGSDADGRLLYARSVIDCARRGLSREEIQFRYYGKKLTIHYSSGSVASASASASIPKPTPDSTPTPTPNATPASTPRPTLQPTAQPVPQPTSEAAAGATPGLALSLSGVGDPASGPPLLMWLPTASDAAAGSVPAPAVVPMPTVYSLPGTLLLLPTIEDATDVTGLSAYRAEPGLARVDIDVERGWVLH